MEQQRNLIFILLLCAAMFLFWDWNSDKANDQKLEQATIQQSQEINSNTAVGKVIKLVSDKLELTINLQGGDIIDAKLLDIKQEQDKDDPFHMLMTTPQFIYQAQSGLAGKDGIDNLSRPEYVTDKTELQLKTAKTVLKQF